MPWSFIAQGKLWKKQYDVPDLPWTIQCELTLRTQAWPLAQFRMCFINFFTQPSFCRGPRFSEPSELCRTNTQDYHSRKPRPSFQKFQKRKPECQRNVPKESKTKGRYKHHWGIQRTLEPHVQSAEATRTEVSTSILSVVKLTSEVRTNINTFLFFCKWTKPECNCIRCCPVKNITSQESHSKWLLYSAGMETEFRHGMQKCQ